MRTTIHPLDIAPVAPGLVRVTNGAESPPVARAIGAFHVPIALNTEGARTAVAATDREPPQAAKTSTELTPEEKAICKKLGIDEADYLAAKQAEDDSATPGTTPASNAMQGGATQGDAARRGTAQAPGAKSPDDEDTSQLTREELDLCAKTGVKPAAYAKEKAKGR